MPIQHQLAGAVALLIASKLSDQPGLSLSQLQEYTGQAFTGQELRGWEVALLTKLGWDVSSQTAWAELVVLVMGTDKEHLLLEEQQTSLGCVAARRRGRPSARHQS